MSNHVRSILRAAKPEDPLGLAARVAREQKAEKDAAERFVISNFVTILNATFNIGLMMSGVEVTAERYSEALAVWEAMYERRILPPHFIPVRNTLILAGEQAKLAADEAAAKASEEAPAETPPVEEPVSA